MIWGAGALAGFAEGAGFATSDLPLAVAVALSASGGNDAFTATPTPGALTRCVGLWQLSAPVGDGGALSPLLDPYRNAQAALEAYDEAGEAWVWCIGWQTGRWRLYLPEATRAVEAGQRVDAVLPFGTLEV